MRLRASIVRASCVGFFLLAPILTAFSQTVSNQIDPRVLGTWKLNLAKSKFDPPPAPASMTVTRNRVGDAVKYTIEIVEPSGNHATIVETPKYDGKDYPRTGSPDADTIALKRINANTVEEILKKSGKVVQTAKQVVSKDGKAITTTLTGTNAKGQTVHYLLVYDKQ